MKEARKRRGEYFPGVEPLRHTTAHSGQNEARSKIHAPDGQFALFGFRQPEDIFFAPYQGKFRTLAITQESLRRITGVVVEYLGAFEEKSRLLEKQVPID